ncbi:TonB-dependent receptor [Luteimonas sp. 3794]|uniref:TonB-dependent receptor n=1 Tax=Luteimonas sp. 3794 TaxID=2817730 RepID=UPI002860D0B0|nr:TonB-dependent receptor [Luteimonas sp. 3794]MDR6991758.1 outer membrane receptor protein involved in Fe transport [Luteimonas sp. 3794]
MPVRVHPLVPPLLAGLALLAATPAIAQSTSSALQELDKIVVTAQKREQQVQDVPIAITAYSGEFLDALGIDGFEQLGNYVPGLQTQVQSPNNPGFVIRGITSDSGDATSEPRVSVFQDGVSISRSRGSVVELFDMERVEVLRGPQGTLFGRGAQIGAVHLIQNKARDTFGGAFRAGFGNFGETYFTGHLNTPLVDDALYGRIAVFHQQRDGTIDNLAGGDLNGRDTQAIRGALRWDLGDTGTLDLILNHQRDTPPGTAFRSGSIPTREGRIAFWDSAADLNRGEALGLDRTVDSATLLGEFRLSDDWTLSSITGWRRFDSTEQFDGDGSQVDLLEFAEIAEGRQFSQEIRFNYDAGGAFRGFAGVSAFDESGSQRVPFSTDERSLYALLSPTLTAAAGGLLPVVPLLNPDGTPNTSLSVINVHPALQQMLGLPPLLPLKARHTEEYANFGDVRALEAFADGTWSMTDRFDLTLGLRYTREEITSGYEALYYGTPSVLGLFLPSFPDNVAFPNALSAPTAGRLQASDTFSSAVGRAVAAYRFADDLNGYASVSRGRRPDLLQFNDGAIEQVDAEIVGNYEVGLKGAASDGRFVYDLAAFYYDYSNFQAQVENPSGTPFFITANGGNARAVGFEAALTNRFTDRLSGFLNYGWIDAKFNALDDDDNPQSLAGNRFRLTPEHTVALGLDWQLPFGAGHAFYVRPNYSWRAKVFFEDDNSPAISQDAFGLLNLNAGVRLAGGWDLQAYVQNLTDETYLVDAGNTGALFGTPTFVPGSPRLYGVRVGYTF